MLKEQPFIFCLLDKSFVQMSVQMSFNQLSITFSCECHCLESNTFSESFFDLEVLSICLPYVKCFIFRSGSEVFFLGLKYLIFCCFREYQFQRDQILQFEDDIFYRKFSTMEVFGMCLPYVKRYFQPHQ